MGASHLASNLRAVSVTEERSCFEAFQSEFDYLCRTLRRLGVRPEDLEDDAHEVFLVLNRKWAEYDPSRPLRPYLFGIAFRVVAALKRRRQRKIPIGIGDQESPAAGQEEALQAAHAREIVLAALAKVPLERRAVLVMHDIDDMPMRDVVSALSIP